MTSCGERCVRCGFGSCEVGKRDSGPLETRAAAKKADWTGQLRLTAEACCHAVRTGIRSQGKYIRSASRLQDGERDMRRVNHTSQLCCPGPRVRQFHRHVPV